jgi:hypothetical protein
MEPNQVHLVAAAVFRDPQQIVDTLETGFARQIVRQLVWAHRLNRVHDDVSVVHAVAAANLHVRSGPDANAAPDPAAANPFTKVFRELHYLLLRKACVTPSISTR